MYALALLAFWAGSIAPSFSAEPESLPTRAARSRAEYCQYRKQVGYFKSLARSEYNRLQFRNQGGLFNGGVCWWHSLFQRAALYLAVFRPDLPRPTKSEAKALIHSIAAGKKVVEIPGYRHLWTFSYDFEDLIQRKLEEWQRVDGFLKFAWLKGLQGHPRVDPGEIKKRLDTIHHLVDDKSEVHWAMLQTPGISSHSALFTDVLRGPYRYDLEVIDSNRPTARRVFYYYPGDDAIYLKEYDHFVPYVGRKSDLKNFRKASDRYCAENRRQGLATGADSRESSEDGSTDTFGDTLGGSLDEHLSNDLE